MKRIIVSPFLPYACAALLCACSTMRAPEARAAETQPVVAGVPIPNGPNLPVQTSWIGNTFGGADNKWVQDAVDEMEVMPDGTVITSSEWDESGRCTGLYKDGQPNTTLLKQFDGKGGHKAWGWGTANQAVTFDAETIYLVNTEGELLRFRRKDNSYMDATPVARVTAVDGKRSGGAVGLTCADGNLYVVRDNGEIIVHRTADLSRVRSFSVLNARDLAVARDGSLWILAGKQILHYSAQGQPMPQKITDAGTPTAVALDNQGRLIVCDNGARRQVLFYDVSRAPRLASTFGVPGGIDARIPGRVEPVKLHSLAGAGTDARGNLYVALSNAMVDCTVLRQFRPAARGGWTPGWELNGVHFVDSAVFIPGTDGTQIYSRSRRFMMDYSRPPGQQWTIAGYTIDPATQYDKSLDARQREAAYHPAFIRRLNGQMLVYMTPMMSGDVEIYTLRPGTEYLQSAYTFRNRLGWGFYVDEKGDIWEAGGKKMRRTPFQGVDANGKPQFGTAQEWDAPAPFNDLMRVHYSSATDTMYLSGYVPGKQEESWGLLGKVMARYDNWSGGNRTPTWTIDLPHDFKPKAGPRVIMKGMAVEGDYIFMVGVDTVARILVFRTRDGGFVGTLDPGPEVGGAQATGWIDMPESISALRRQNGEYAVLVEEDGRNKIILYRWKPTP